MSEIWEEIQEHLAKISLEQAAAVEAVCEDAVQTGLHGVSVWRWIDGTTVKLEARVDPSVPYGRMREFVFGDRPPDE